MGQHSSLSRSSTSLSIRCSFVSFSLEGGWWSVSSSGLSTDELPPADVSPPSSPEAAFVPPQQASLHASSSSLDPSICVLVDGPGEERRARLGAVGPPSGGEEGAAS